MVKKQNLAEEARRKAKLLEMMLVKVQKEKEKLEKEEEDRRKDIQKEARFHHSIISNTSQISTL